MGIGGAVIGILSIASIYIFDKKSIKIMLILFAGGISVFVAMVSGILPASFITDLIDLSKRGVIWNGIIEAVLQQPLFGYGPGIGADIIYNYKGIRVGPHNSFLRLYLISGLIGGFAYVLFILFALIRSVPEQLPSEKVVLYPVLVAIIIRHTFSGETIFGINALSVTAAIIIGYAIKQSTPSNTTSEV